MMVVLTRRCAPLLLALSALLAVPSVAAAQRGGGSGGGGYDYESLGCSSTRVLIKSGRCDSRRPAPEVFASPSTPRAGAPVKLFGDSPGRGVTLAWDLDNDGAFDDGTGETIEKTFPAGVHTVRVKATDEDGRSGEGTTTLQVHAVNMRPTGGINATPYSPRVDQQVTVNGYAYDPDGSLAKTELDLDGNGAYEVTLTGEEAQFAERTITYATAGKRTVRARYTDDAGATSVATTTVDVHASNIAPVTSLSVSPAVGRVGQEVRVSAFASDIDGRIAHYEFDLDGDNTYETDAGTSLSTKKTFNQAGTQTIGVRVTDDAGGTATSRRTVEVKQGNDAPTVSIFGTGRSFSAFGNDPDGGITQYAWDLDDDGVFDDLVGPFASSASLPAGTYGTFEVAVRVTDTDGAVATARRIVTLRDEAPGIPTILSSPAQPRVGDSVFLSAGSDSDDVTKVEWDLGSGSFGPASTSTSTQTTFATAGTRTVRVRVTDSKGRSAIGRREITVAAASPANLPPSASISVASPSLRVGGSTQVSDFSSDSDGSIASHAWDLDDDGQFDDGTQQSATAGPFNAAGTYRIGLKVTDDKGAESTQYQLIDVHTDNRAPRPQISPQGAPGAVVAPGQNLTLSAFVTGSDDAITAFRWDTDADGNFDDGTGQSVVVNYATAGERRVSVEVEDQGGAKGTATILVDVRAPQANRAPTLTLSGLFGAARPGQAISLSASVSDPDGDFPTVTWDADGDGQFDDGTGGAIQYTYAQAGTYNVSARADDGKGGVRTAMQTVTVAPDPALAPIITGFGFSGPVRAGRPATISVFAQNADGTIAGLTLSWDLDGDGEFDDTPTPGGYGSYNWTFTAPVTIAVRATDSAQRTAVRTLDVDPGTENLAPRAQIYASGPVIANQSLTLEAVYADPDGAGPPTVAWDLDGNGVYDNGSTPEVTVTVPDQVGATRTVGLRVTDAEGAAVTITRTVTVGSKQPVATFTASDATPDLGQDVVLTSTASDPDGTIVSSAWDLDDDGAFDDGTGPVAHVAYTTRGARLVGLKVRDSNGDTGIEYMRLEVPPLVVPTPTPTATPGPTQTATPQTQQTTNPGATAKDTTPPTLTATPKAPKLAALIKTGFPVQVKCSEACSVTVVAAVDKATAKRLKLGKTLEVGRGTTKLAKAGSASVVVKLSAKAKKALKKQRKLKLKLTITAVDVAGNRSQATKSVTVRR